MVRKYFINKNYGIMAFSKLISMAGTYIQEFALSLYVLKMTGSAAMFASVLAVAVIPQIIIGPLAGVIVDWMNKKAILITMDFISGILTALSIGVMLYDNKLPMYMIYILVISLSAISTIYSTAGSSTIVLIVDKEQLVQANSTNSFINTFTQLISGVLGGAIYGFFGLLPCLIFNAVSFFFSAILQMFMTIQNEVKNKQDINVNEFFRSLSEGFEFIKKQKYILKLVISAFFINFALSPFFSIAEVYVIKRVYKVSDMQLGVFQSVIVLGSLSMPFILPKLAKKYKMENMFSNGIIIMSLVIGGITFTYSSFFIKLCGGILIPYIAFIILTIVILNVALMINITNQTMMQQLVPKNMMGRVFSVMTTVCMAAMPIGQWLMGQLLDSVNTVYLGIGVCIITFVVAVVYKYTGNAAVKEGLEEVI